MKHLIFLLIVWSVLLNLGCKTKKADSTSSRPPPPAPKTVVLTENIVVVAKEYGGNEYVYMNRLTNYGYKEF